MKQLNAKQIGELPFTIGASPCFDENWIIQHTYVNYRDIYLIYLFDPLLNYKW